MTLRNQSLSHVRGFNYHPSFASHGITRWVDRYDPAKVEQELSRGKELFPWMNTLRIWLSLDAWRDNRDVFLNNLNLEIETFRRLNLKIMPVLYNGISNIPDYGSLNWTDVDRLMKPDGGNNLRVLFLDYVADIARRYAQDEIVAVWDLCNEPGLHYQNKGDSMREGIFTLLQASSDELRKFNITAPVGVGNYGPVRDDARCIGFVDCLLTHRYHVPHCMTIETFRANVKETADFANTHNLPWCVSECTWGKWDDHERAALLSGLEEFLNIGAGVLPYVLWESPAMDAHGTNSGISYGWGAPEDLCFIRKNGHVRNGHEIINRIMANYPTDAPEPTNHRPIKYQSFRPGQRWLDTEGNPIQAHGGGILQHNRRWYWYGENKSMPTKKNSNGVSRTDLVGVSCYSSDDLYNWKNEGVVLPASNHPTDELYYSNVLERPKVIFNPTTQKFVMWFHLDSENYKWRRAGVAISDTPVGPFVYLGSMQPKGNQSGDLSVFQDTDGSAYLFYSSENNETMHVVRLSDDYTAIAGASERILIGQVREAPVIFRQDDLYYLITSACTGWNDNRAMLATAPSPLGPWLVLRGGDICVGDLQRTSKTFESQGTYALVIQRENQKQAIIFMADRWNQNSLGDSRYIWLPITIRGRFAYITWHNEWTLQQHFEEKLSPVSVPFEQ